MYKFFWENIFSLTFFCTKIYGNFLTLYWSQVRFFDQKFWILVLGWPDQNPKCSPRLNLINLLSPMPNPLSSHSSSPPSPTPPPPPNSSPTCPSPLVPYLLAKLFFSISPCKNPMYLYNNNKKFILRYKS